MDKMKAGLVCELCHPELFGPWPYVHEPPHWCAAHWKQLMEEYLDGYVDMDPEKARWLLEMILAS